MSDMPTVRFLEFWALRRRAEVMFGRRANDRAIREIRQLQQQDASLHDGANDNQNSAHEGNGE